MDTEKLYQSIFRRRSIRRYDMTPLEASVIDEVSKLIPSLKPLYDIKIHISLVPGNTIRGMMAVRSPHYLILSSEKKDGYLENAGFILQQMDLAILHGAGLLLGGSCKAAGGSFHQAGYGVRNRPGLWKVHGITPPGKLVGIQEKTSSQDSRYS